ncbi:HD-GYP domain-containing protein [Cohnella sp. AR92]|uniref:HD-GYP domain-containing protein n=1 Tax=Cohnella sp. AR92 TaxID=648716 RepID=UPI000F8C9030|nr:HD-GYP domain-containing protein [Cohnella sp. AR92]RUS43581.1 HD-GYP domain-containing protein [Cohnella sp. AR92]
MRMMPLASIHPGMKLGKKIYSEEGIVLLAEGVELTGTLLRRLGDKGIHYLYIQDPRTEGIEAPELLSEETHRQALSTLRSVFRDLVDQPGKRHAGTYPYVGKTMRQLMHSVMEELHRSKDSMIMLMNMQTVDHYLYMHSLNVCVYTVLLGMAYGYNSEELSNLGLGALLHDVGKTQISMDVLLKPGRLSHEEYEEMKRHAERGFYLLKDEPNIPLLVAHCAYQHHERLDGSGYPRGLQGYEIHEYAKWIGIVDSYDAMTSHRVYKNPMLPHQATETLYAGSGTLYDTAMLKIFRDKVAIYPVGISVTLSTGQTAIVVDINAASVHRPIVRVLTDESGADLKTPYDLDLSKNLSVMINRIDAGPSNR